jgi:hypothetical protein
MVNHFPDWWRTPTGLVMLAIVGTLALVGERDDQPLAAAATARALSEPPCSAGSTAACARAARASEAAAHRLLAMAKDGAPIAAQRHALASAVRARGVSAATTARLMAHTRAGITLTHDGAKGRSRLGGAGVLPDGVGWPADPDGGAMTFLARIDLAEMPRLEPLPARGTLLFFLDLSSGSMDPYRTTRVLWVPPGTALQDAHGGGANQLKPVPLAGVAMPIAGEQQAIDGETTRDPQQQRLFDAMNDMSPILYRHQLLGADRDIQGPVLDEVSYWLKEAGADTRSHFTPSERAGHGWMLLAEFDEDGDAGLSMADGGSVYFVIQRADLVARRFDRVLAIVQSH